jgi:hypothetical protein
VSEAKYELGEMVEGEEEEVAVVVVVVVEVSS